MTVYSLEWRDRTEPWGWEPLALLADEAEAWKLWAVFMESLASALGEDEYERARSEYRVVERDVLRAAGDFRAQVHPDMGDDDPHVRVLASPRISERDMDVLRWFYERRGTGGEVADAARELGMDETELGRRVMSLKSRGLLESPPALLLSSPEGAAMGRPWIEAYALASFEGRAPEPEDRDGVVRWLRRNCDVPASMPDAAVWELFALCAGEERAARAEAAAERRLDA